MLYVADVDGCIVPADRTGVDLDALGHLRSALDEMRSRRKTDRFTLCTGRPAPYVELIFQLIGGPWAGLPAIVEYGCFLYHPTEGGLTPHPTLVERREALADARRAVDALLSSPRWAAARREPGKEVCISINPPPGARMESFFRAVLSALGETARDLEVTHSLSAVDITPRGVDKGSGLAFLCHRVGADAADCVAIGDSRGDLALLRAVGHPAAPGNCDPEVRRICEYVSPLPGALGVADILCHYHSRRAT